MEARPLSFRISHAANGKNGKALLSRRSRDEACRWAELHRSRLKPNAIQFLHRRSNRGAAPLSRAGRLVPLVALQRVAGGPTRASAGGQGTCSIGADLTDRSRNLVRFSLSCSATFRLVIQDSQSLILARCRGQSPPSRFRTAVPAKSVNSAFYVNLTLNGSSADFAVIR